MSDITNNRIGDVRQSSVSSETRDEHFMPRKPISSTLRALNVGEEAVFPIEQRTSVLIVANRIKKELSRIGWDYAPTENETDYTISIKRTQ